LVHESVSNERIEHALSGQVLDKKIYLKDKVGTASVRLGFNRNDYKVKPGIYALGCPTKDSDVLVTCNYKLTVDMIRSTVKKDYWLLIIDTDGVNVWCAAGKGSFGSAELIYSIKEFDLDCYVSHKRIILPQLGAPGIQDYLITQLTGYQVVYGTIRIEDLETFIENDYKTNEGMRSVTFKLKDRMVLTPLELIKSFRFIGVVLLLCLVIPVFELEHFLMFLTGSLVGTVIFPVVLPIRPFRMFYKNGILLSMVLNIPFILSPSFITLAWYVLSASFAGYLSLNFTGSTTFTSLSGVRKETEEAVKVLAFMVVVSIAFIVVGLLGVLL